MKCVHRTFNVHNHHYDPCQINRERLDGRQGAEHMEKGSWEREGKSEEGRTADIYIHFSRLTKLSV